MVVSIGLLLSSWSVAKASPERFCPGGVRLHNPEPHPFEGWSPPGALQDRVVQFVAQALALTIAVHDKKTHVDDRRIRIAEENVSEGDEFGFFP